MTVDATLGHGVCVPNGKGATEDATSAIYISAPKDRRVVEMIQEESLLKMLVLISNRTGVCLKPFGTARPRKITN